MCGICGVARADPREPVCRSDVTKMMAALQHRGPDGEGACVGVGFGLGFRRLSIIDLETGAQPISNEDRSIQLVCNGEIYNAPELRAELEARGHRFRSRSDAEIIVHLYEEVGAELVHRLRGMFGLALWDRRRRQMLLARDRLGIKPLCYRVDARGLWFGSESKAVLAGGETSAVADPLAIRDLLSLGFVTGGRTMFADIRRLPPGHYLIYEEGRASVTRYWALPVDAEETHLTEGEWAEALREKLSEVVGLHLRSDVPVGAWLSTGIDSSAIVGLAGAASAEPIPTFTMAMEDPAFDETRSQATLDTFSGFRMLNERTVCDDRSFELYPRAIWHAEEPSAACMEIGRMLLGRLAGRRVKVVLTGEGSDELFYGYVYHRLVRRVARLSAIPGPLLRALARAAFRAGRRTRTIRLLLAPRGEGDECYARLVGPLHRERGPSLLSRSLRGAIATHREGGRGLGAHDDTRCGSSQTRMAHRTAVTMMPDLVVHTLDRGSMAYGVEARVPFLDHQLVELCARIPPQLKIRGSTGKYILRRALRGVVPDEICRRRKRAPVVPLERWLRQPLPPFAEPLLSPRGLRDKGYFDANVVRALLAQHRAGRGDFSRLLMVVLGVQLWDDLFVQGRVYRHSSSQGTPSPSLSSERSPQSLYQ